jgi:hypothetical protein
MHCKDSCFQFQHASQRGGPDRENPCAVPFRLGSLINFGSRWVRGLLIALTAGQVGARSRIVVDAIQLCARNRPIQLRTYVSMDIIWQMRRSRSIPRPDSEAGDVVILDNLGSRKGQGARKAIPDVGARLVFLPRYSPDLNPIEQVFAKLKTCSVRSGREVTKPLPSLRRNPRPIPARQMRRRAPSGLRLKRGRPAIRPPCRQPATLYTSAIAFLRRSSAMRFGSISGFL